MLKEFQRGYETRNKDEVNSFVDRLFLPGNSVFVLGTGSGELFSGAEKVKELISDDWEYWGNLRLDHDKARIGTAGDHGWFAVEGTVSRSFEDSEARTDRYLSFVADKAKDESMSPGTRLALVNWVLSLTFSRRRPGRRDYAVPVVMSGSVQVHEGEWKFAHIHFSLPASDFPDERFEESEAFVKNYAEACSRAASFAENAMDPEIEALLNNFAQLSENCMEKEHPAELIGPGAAHTLADLSSLGSLDFDTGSALAVHDGTQGWVAALGKLHVERSEDSFFSDALSRLQVLLSAQASSADVLFSAHRLAASALKEGSMGTSYTYPVRLTASIARSGGSWRIRQAHLSCPDYWLLEGKAGTPV